MKQQIYMLIKSNPIDKSMIYGMQLKLKKKKRYCLCLGSHLSAQLILWQ